MMLDPWWGLALSTTRSFELARDQGVERGWFLVGGGLAHCWVLKHQGHDSSVPCSGLVGLLFEICIVDASIN